MKLTFRQGIVSNQDNFLTRVSDGIVLSTTNKPTIATVSHGSTNYLIVEPVRGPTKLWLIPPLSTDYWIYWDINLITAEKTYGYTLLPPIVQPSAPHVPIIDQHWFSSETNKMFVWNGTRWVEKIRVFAAKVDEATVVLPYAPGTSQIGSYQPNSSGIILFDDFGKAIKRDDGTFLTSENALLMNSSVTYTSKVEAFVSYNFANESIPAFSVVKVVGTNRVELSDYEDTINHIHAFSSSPALFDDPVSVVYDGIITRPEWNWTTGSKLWISSHGQMTEIDPHSTNPFIPAQPPVARAITPDTILFSPNGGMGSVLTNGGSSDPVVIPNSSSTVAGITKLSVAPLSINNPIAVGSNDPRMTDARTPTAHSHTASDITNTPITGLTSSNVQSVLQEMESQFLAHAGNVTHLTPSQQSLLNGITVSASDINNLTSITGPIQTQLNSKQSALGYIPVNKSGDSMLGPLVLSADPVALNHAATKNYVDSATSFTSGFFAAPAQDAAALSLFTSSSVVDKQVRLVDDLGALFRYDDQSTEASNGTTVISPIDNPISGRWIKIQSASTNHNVLTGLQGGSVDNYYHVTFNEKNGYDSHLLNTNIHVTPAEKTLLSGISVSASTINSLYGITSPLTTLLAGKQSTLGYVPVNKNGDTMVGTLVLSSDPIGTMDAVTKQYVDNISASAAPVSHNHDLSYVNIMGDTMTGALILHANPAVALGAATKQYVDAQVVLAASSVTGGNGLVKTGSQLDVVGASGRIVSNADNIDLAQVGNPGTYYSVTTDAYGRVISGVMSPSQMVTLVGDVTGSGTTSITTSLPPTGVEAGTYTKVVVNAKGLVTSGSVLSVGDLPVGGYVGTFLPLSGGTLTNFLTLHANPTLSLHATTKQYVDTQVASATGSATSKVSKAGDTMTGLLVLSADPSVNLGAATKQYVDTQVASATGSATSKVSKAGDTMTGALILNANPSVALGAATKQYVDAQSTTITGKVSKSGDTMTGLLVLSADPSVALGAATKQYVDTGLSGKSNNTHNHDAVYAPILHTHSYASTAYVDAKSRYDIASGVVGSPESGVVVLRFVSPTTFSFAASMLNSKGGAGTQSAATATFILLKNGIAFASMIFATSNAATFTGSLTTFTPGDVLTMTAPVPQDVSLTDVYYTLVGTLS